MADFRTWLRWSLALGALIALVVVIRVMQLPKRVTIKLPTVENITSIAIRSNVTSREFNLEAFEVTGTTRCQRIIDVLRDAEQIPANAITYPFYAGIDISLVEGDPQHLNLYDEGAGSVIIITTPRLMYRDGTRREWDALLLDLARESRNDAGR